MSLSKKDMSDPFAVFDMYTSQIQMETVKSRNREKEIAKKNMILEKKNEMLQS